MQQRSEQSWFTTVSLGIIAVVALAAALVYTRTIMIPFVVAVFIVALVAPIQDFQVRRLRLPRFIATIVTLLFVLFVMAVVSVFVVQAIRTIASTAGEYSTSFAKMANKLLKPIEYVYKREEPKPTPPASSDDPNSKSAATHEEPKPVPKQPAVLELYPFIEDNAKPAELEVQPQPIPPAKDSNEAVDPNAPPGTTVEHSLIDTKQIAKDLADSAKQVVRDMANKMFAILTNAVQVIFGLISGVLFVLIFVVFLLAGRNPYAEHSQVYRDVVQKIGRYVGIHFVISAVTGVLVWASLTIIGLPLAGVFGVVAFVLNWIPSIGSIIVTLLPIPIAVAEFHDSLWLIVLVVAVPGAIQNLLGNIIEPKLMGEGLDLHPVTILLALSFWGLVWGIVGMFLAAPITAAIRIVLMQFDMLKPIGNLLAGNFAKAQAPEPETARQAEAEATPSSTPPEAVEPGGSLPE
ncbi:MAG: AI-2E family transporter [Planctomycetaceae bacterium]|nr:MAG: AI-2E family transporter [Planctomycetaceae bacterium]